MNRVRWMLDILIDFVFFMLMASFVAKHYPERKWGYAAADMFFAVFFAWEMCSTAKRGPAI